MASVNDILPYEKSEIERVLDEERINIRNSLNKRFLGAMPDHIVEPYISRWMAWIKPSQSEDVSNVHFADPKRSDKAALERINETGENLIKKGSANTCENVFEGDISTAANVSSYMNSMILALRKFEKSAEISENEIKIILGNILEQAISSAESIDSTIQKEWHSPIITKNGSIAWVKFNFTLTNTIREAFYSSHQIKIKVISYYCSDSELI